MKDQADASAPNLPEVLRRRIEKIFSLEEDCTSLNFPVGWQKPQKNRGKCAFAGTGFSEYAEDFSGRKIKTNTCQGGADFARAVGVCDAEVLDFEKGCHAMDQWLGISQPLSHGLLRGSGGQDGRIRWRRKGNDR